MIGYKPTDGVGPLLTEKTLDEFVQTLPEGHQARLQYQRLLTELSFERTNFIRECAMRLIAGKCTYAADAWKTAEIMWDCRPKGC